MWPAVVIADSDGDLGDLYRMFFTRQGWRVRLAGSGIECLAHLRKSPPHALIVDTHLPWGGADGLLAVMREEPQFAKIPVVITSSDPSVLTRFESSSPAAAAVLLKPFSVAELFERIRSQLGKH